ncbi:hypothetical protein CCP4SC76_7640009 [Gammaproteobacteria bacterium]
MSEEKAVTGFICRFCADDEPDFDLSDHIWHVGYCDGCEYLTSVTAYPTSLDDKTEQYPCRSIS